MINKKEKFYLPVNNTVVEVSEEVYRVFYQMARREKYLVERDIANQVYSYNNLDGMIENGENILYCNLLGRTDQEYTDQTRSDQLEQCLTQLTQAERELIYAIYYDQLTETEYGVLRGMSQRGVGKKRKKILSKMRAIMDYLESNDDFVLS